MSNDRYVSALRDFAADDYFQAASIGAFNSAEFGAFVLFYLTGDFQDLNGTPAEMFLWGNADSANDTGWSLQIVDSGGAPTLRATIGDGVTTTNLDTALIIGGAYIERLILASVYSSGDFCALAVNGTIAAFDAAIVTAPSALAARVGYDPAGANPATYAGIIACGYQSGALAGDSSRAIGQYAANHFRAAREDLAGSLQDKPADLDWLHRYESRSFAPGVQGTLQRNATGQARLATPAQPSGPWRDVGNSGFVTSGAAAAPLTRIAPP